MTRKRARKSGKQTKSIKVQDIQKSVYQSYIDSSNEILPKRDRSQAEKATENSGKKSEEVTDSLNLLQGSGPENQLISDLKENKFVHSHLEQGSLEPLSSRELASKKSESPSEKSTTGETEDLTSSGRKRNSLSQSPSVPKRVKTEPTKKMDDYSNFKPLEIELQLERNREPFKRRNINTIIEELDTISRKLKEGYEKFKTPTFWGAPTVKQCSEKWDPNFIPERLLDFCEKRYEMAQPCCSSSLSERLAESFSEYKAGDSKTCRSCPEGVDEEAFEASEFGNLDDSSTEDSYGSSSQGRMTLRSRNSNRPNYDERSPGDASRDTLGRDKSSRRSSFKSSKERKTSGSKKRSIAELERGHDAHSTYLDDDLLDPNTDFEKLSLDESGPSTSMGAGKSLMEEKVIALPSRMIEEEQVACPVCGKNFEKTRIETHATHCATETYRD